MRKVGIMAPLTQSTDVSREGENSRFIKNCRHEFPGLDVLELTDGKVIVISRDDEAGYLRVGVYFDEKQAFGGNGVIVVTREVVNAAENCAA